MFDIAIAFFIQYLTCQNAAVCCDSSVFASGTDSASAQTAGNMRAMSGIIIRNPLFFYKIFKCSQSSANIRVHRKSCIQKRCRNSSARIRHRFPWLSTNNLSDVIHISSFYDSGAQILCFRSLHTIAMIFLSPYYMSKKGTLCNRAYRKQEILVFCRSHMKEIFTTVVFKIFFCTGNIDNHPHIS